MKKSIIFAMTICLITMFAASHQAFASNNQICVYQESAPSAGDFSFLGTIDVFDFSSESAAAVYRYANPHGASYNGDVWWPGVAPDALEETSQLFVVDTNDGSGVSLFIVHDKYQDEEGGNADMQLNLSGDIAGVLVEDDPGEPIIVSGGGTQFNTDHGWAPCCTDGGVIGTLEGNWSMDIQFLSVDMTRITAWQATSADGSMIPLALELERLVRLQPCPIEVPLDIKPNSYPNPLNLKDSGVLPVAILGTEDFDVTYYIDPASITLDGGLGVHPLRWSFEDVASPFVHNCHQFCSDGYPDLLLKFDMQEVVAALIAAYGVELEDGLVVPLSIEGRFYEELSGTPIRGVDVVKILIKGMDQPK